jgi:hypothetical protein
MIIVIYVKKCYLLLEEILKYLNKNNQIKWQKTIGLEVLSELFKQPEMLFDLFINNNNLYQNIFQVFINTTYNAIFLKSQKINDKKSQISSTNQSNISNNKKQTENHPELIIPNKKYILNSNIFTNENDQIIHISINNDYIFKLLSDCYIFVKNSYISLLEKNGININITSSSQKEENKLKNENQEKIKEMINSNIIDFKGGLIGMLLHINDIGLIQSFISIFQTFIYIFSSFGLSSLKNELLNDLCQLAITNNL